MKKKAAKLKLKDIPVYEHLAQSLKCTYTQRLQWLEEANDFVRILKKNKKYPHWTKKT